MPLRRGAQGAGRKAGRPRRCVVLACNVHRVALEAAGPRTEPELFLITNYTLTGYHNRGLRNLLLSPGLNVSKGQTDSLPPAPIVCLRRSLNSLFEHPSSGTKAAGLGKSFDIHETSNKTTGFLALAALSLNAYKFLQRPRPQPPVYHTKHHNNLQDSLRKEIVRQSHQYAGARAG